MKIKMLETKIGSETGHEVKIYQKGEVYVVGQWLAHHFFKDKSAILFNDSLGKRLTGNCIDW